MTSVATALATGGLRIRPDGEFDFGLPLYMVLTLVLLLWVAHLRLSAWTGGAAFLLGTVWAWAATETGVVTAGGTALLMALAVGRATRRSAREQRSDPPC